MQDACTTDARTVRTYPTTGLSIVKGPNKVVSSIELGCSILAVT
jgi:hypothetical protein